MKTTMQELIDDLKELKKHSKDNKQDTSFDIGMTFAIARAELRLKKEKEQLNVSFISGAIEALSSSTPVRDRIKDGYFENKAEQYFEYTYKTNKL